MYLREHFPFEIFYQFAEEDQKWKDVVEHFESEI